MSYSAYRRLLSNPRYTGRWAFGRKRNSWNNSLDYNVQFTTHDTEVVMFECDELRIVSDELFHQVQAVLASNPTGPRRAREAKKAELWDLVTGCFFCAACSASEKKLVRMYKAGANGNGMRCKHDDLCLCKSTVRRCESVVAICNKLCELIRQDAVLIADVFTRANQLNLGGNNRWQAELQRVTRRISVLGNKLQDLYDLAGTGTEDDRTEITAAINAARAERAAARVERDQLNRLVHQQSCEVTEERVEEILHGFTQLLINGANGTLGEDVMHHAVAAFQMLVGDCVLVHVERRGGRKTTNVRGVFTPQWIGAVKRTLDDPRTIDGLAATPVEVWLRRPPKLDLLAPTVRDLIEVQNLSFRGAEKFLRAQGHILNSGIVWQAYRRYYQMMDQPMPKIPYNNGIQRKAR